MARILLIDGDPAAAARHRSLLEHAGHEVRVEGDVPSAEQAALSLRFHLILLDTLAPLGDGQALLASLASRGEAGPPVIALTARGNPRDVARAFSDGAADYMIKPVPPPILLARVATQLRLRDALGRLAATNADLLRLSELKGRMVSVVSHELRTPLTSIRGALELVSRASEELPPRSERLMAICLRNTDRLIRLVNGVLTFARVEAGMPLNLEALDTAALVARAGEEVEILCDDKGVRLVVEGPEGAGLRGDGDRIHQILVNLLSNAIRHTPPRSTVHLKARAVPGGMRFEVSDEGPGIAPEDQARLFLPFSQLAAPPSSPGGTGLGLAISRELVLRHGGAIGVDSEVGAGSTFWFEIPTGA